MKENAQTWYASNGCGGQGLIAEEETGRSVAVAYDNADAELLASAPKLLDQSKRMLESVRKIMWLCQQHDPETGHYKTPSPYDILEIVHTRLFTIEVPETISRAKGGAE